MFGGTEHYGDTMYGSGVIGAPIAGLQIFVDGLAAPSVQYGSIHIDEAINERSTAEFTLVNPEGIPIDGSQVLIVRDEERLFQGTIDRVTCETNSTQTLRTYACECTDLSQILDHLVWKATYTNVSAAMVLNDLFANKLANEGLQQGRIDFGATFPLVESDYIRISELVRDMAEGAGMNFWIDPYRRVQMVSTLTDQSPFDLDEDSLQRVHVSKSREDYRNVMIVTCATHDNSGQITIVREDPEQIIARMREGGTGRYEVAEKIAHPFSNDVVEAQRLATSYATIKLSRSGAVRQALDGTVYRRGIRAGQVVTVSLPNYGAAGLWSVTGVKMQCIHAELWQYDITATSTSALQLIIDSYLRIVSAGRALVQLPIGLFTNVVELLATGSWTVPGVGSIDIEMDLYGGGGGGGGHDGMLNINGGHGGAGGKAITFLTVPAGTVFDVSIAAIGLGGAGDGVHTVGPFTTPGTSTWTVPGSGGVRIRMLVNGAGGGGAGLAIAGARTGAGGPGGQAVTTLVIAAGTVVDFLVGAGGAGGPGNTGPPTGNGAAGGQSAVSITGTTYAFGLGGSGGEAATGVNGASGSGGGDAVTPGGGAAGGAAGVIGSINGAAGGDGSITFFYTDTTPGTDGGGVVVTQVGVVRALAAGGVLGVDGNFGGADGANGGGLGDHVFAGAGSAGGAGGNVSTPAGSGGVLGKVQFRY